jgi:hypothetical protein
MKKEKRMETKKVMDRQSNSSKEISEHRQREMGVLRKVDKKCLHEKQS